jgi:hypothetical protein
MFSFSQNRLGRWNNEWRSVATFGESSQKLKMRQTEQQSKVEIE